MHCLKRIHHEPLSHILNEIRCLLPVAQFLIRVDAASSARCVYKLFFRKVPFFVSRHLYVHTTRALTMRTSRRSRRRRRWRRAHTTHNGDTLETSRHYANRKLHSTFMLAELLTVNHNRTSIGRKPRSPSLSF